MPIPILLRGNITSFEDPYYLCWNILYWENITIVSGFLLSTHSSRKITAFSYCWKIFRSFSACGLSSTYRGKKHQTWLTISVYFYTNLGWGEFSQLLNDFYVSSTMQKANIKSISWALEWRLRGSSPMLHHINNNNTQYSYSNNITALELN